MTTPFDDLNPDPPRHRRSFFGWLRASFLTGLVVIAPIGLTLWLIWTVVGWIDSWVWPFVPGAYQPEEVLNRLLGRSRADGDWIDVNVRGVGVIVFLVFTIMVGWLAKGLIGRSLLNWAEGLVGRMPVVRSVYNGVKQIAETVFAQTEASFDKACLVEYPRKGIWAIAFISSSAKGEVARGIPAEGEKISVFLPTTPNPTSGFLLFVPRSAIIELDMSVEDAEKLIISAGLVYHNGKDPTKPPASKKTG